MYSPIIIEFIPPVLQADDAPYSHLAGLKLYIYSPVLLTLDSSVGYPGVTVIPIPETNIARFKLLPSTQVGYSGKYSRYKVEYKQRAADVPLYTEFWIVPQPKEQRTVWFNNNSYTFAEFPYEILSIDPTVEYHLERQKLIIDGPVQNYKVVYQPAITRNDIVVEGY